MQSVLKKSVLVAAMAAGMASVANAGLVIDLQATDSTVITAPGQVVHFNIVATVTGSDADTTNEGLQTFQGNILGDPATTIGGNFSTVSLSATFTNPPNSNAGTATDLNGDGNGDVSGIVGRDANGVAPGNSFIVGTVTWTATKANSGSELLHWQVKTPGLSPTGNWQEDASPKGNTAATGAGSYTAGPGVTVAAPEPGSLALLGLGGLGLLLRRRRAM